MSFECITICPMSPDHLEQVCDIDMAVQYEPWTHHMFSETLKNHRSLCRVLLKDGNLCGYLCALVVADELQILNIAVKREEQGKGLGKILLKAVIEEVSRFSGGTRIVTLEVRESNFKAFKLYASLGFEVVGTRPNYYKTPRGREKAILMELLLDQSF